MEEPEIIELVITPIPPDTIQSVKQEIVPLVEAQLRENGLDVLLADGHFKMQTEQTFPTDAETLAIIAIVGPMAKDTYKELILPLLKRHFGVEAKPRQKDKAAKREEKTLDEGKTQDETVE